MSRPTKKRRSNSNKEIVTAVDDLLLSEASESQADSTQLLCEAKPKSKSKVLRSRNSKANTAEQPAKAKVTDEQADGEKENSKKGTWLSKVKDSLGWKGESQAGKESVSSNHSRTKRKKASTALVSAVPEYKFDDKGYIVFAPGLIINARFELVKPLGKGTFSCVFMARDIAESRYKAVKVIRNLDKYQMAARTELKVLRCIRDNNHAAAPVIHLSDHGYFKAHPLFVFPLYGRSVYRFLADNHFQPFRTADALSITEQVCQAVAYIHSLGIICTDLKPENIVFVSDLTEQSKHPRTGRTYQTPTDTRIKLIDFGSAVFDRNGWHTHLIQTRHYRAPEVMLGLNWSFSADLWSIGCMIVELIYGKMLFNTHDTIDHLNQVVKSIGRMPPSLVDMTTLHTRSQLFLSDQRTLNLSAAKISPVQCRRLDSYFDAHDSGQKELLKLSQACLQWVPAFRISSSHAYRNLKSYSTIQTDQRKKPKHRSPAE